MMRILNLMQAGTSISSASLSSLHEAVAPGDGNLERNVENTWINLQAARRQVGLTHVLLFLGGAWVVMSERTAAEVGIPVCMKSTR